MPRPAMLWFQLQQAPRVLQEGKHRRPFTPGFNSDGDRLAGHGLRPRRRESQAGFLQFLTMCPPKVDPGR